MTPRSLASAPAVHSAFTRGNIIPFYPDAEFARMCVIRLGRVIEVNAPARQLKLSEGGREWTTSFDLAHAARNRWHQRKVSGRI